MPTLTWPWPIGVSCYRHSTYSKEIGGGTGLPETICPRTNVLGPLVPKLNVPCDTMSLDWYIPVILNTYTYCIMHVMKGMYQSRDAVFQGRLIYHGSQNIRTGTHRFRTSRHPTKKYTREMERRKPIYKIEGQTSVIRLGIFKFLCTIKRAS